MVLVNPTQKKNGQPPLGKMRQTLTHNTGFYYDYCKRSTKKRRRKLLLFSSGSLSSSSSCLGFFLYSLHLPSAYISLR